MASPTRTHPVPVTLVAGYLGSGKTTLVNAVLRGDSGERVAVLVNDFGSIAIDASLINSSDGTVVTLTNGCMCCAVDGSVADALTSMLEMTNPPERILIEASGVSNPLAVARSAAVPGVLLDAVVVLADCETVRRRAVDELVGDHVIAQLRCGDLIVLTKIDLVDDATRVEVRDWLATVAPGSPVVDCANGWIDPLVLFHGLPRHGDGPGGAEPTVGDHHVDYLTWTHEQTAPITRDAIAAMADQMPDSVLRVKGFMALDDDPARRHVFQMVGRRWSITADEPWGNEQAVSRFVIIAVAGSDRPTAALDLLSRS